MAPRVRPALRASLDLTRILTAGERHLLEELLNRIADAISGRVGKFIARPSGVRIHLARWMRDSPETDPF